MNRIIKYRWLVIGISAALTVLLALKLTDIKVNADLRDYFPRTMRSVVATDSIESVFGNQDMIILLLEYDDIINPASLERTRNIDKAIQRLPGIRKTNSLFNTKHIYGMDGVMYVDPAIRRLPRTAKACENLKAELLENDLAKNIVVAEDFRSTAIIATLGRNVDEEALFNSIDEIINEYPGPEKVHLGGLPYLRLCINHDIRRDGLILIPAALLLMIVFLTLVFREWRGVVLPFLVVLMACILALALLPLLG